MPVLDDLRINTKVRISAPGVGACVGRIEDIRAAADMPDLPGFDRSGEFAPCEIMREGGVTRHAMISYHRTPEQEVIFTALEIGGDWYDLHRQKLTLEVIGQYEWRRPPELAADVRTAGQAGPDLGSVGSLNRSRRRRSHDDWLWQLL